MKQMGRAGTPTAMPCACGQPCTMSAESASTVLALGFDIQIYKDQPGPSGPADL